MARLIDRKVPVAVEFDVAVDFPEEAVDVVNVIAEIPGGRKRDEVVILGAHLDSSNSGAGATDNAAGCAVVLEAVRILKALDPGAPAGAVRLQRASRSRATRT